MKPAGFCRVYVSIPKEMSKEEIEGIMSQFGEI
jgi:hypothetical protein